MKYSNFNIVVILLCGAITLSSRTLPFVLLNQRHLSKKVEKFLTILPITILSTLWFQNLFDQSSGVLPEVNYANFTASLPTLVVAILSKDLLLTIFVGVISYVLFTTLLS
ncbi:AzlD domain-containing protein [Leuconostoc falkenbergense]|jgi:branched-subunit amino acid transport protein|uniref:AzlD domain-containing protein n=1 Tax=Leuconostoc falkenbergense TaxID=2766470 RepID=A0A9X3IPU6_9LACO|nr:MULTISPECIES: AzlD domain-containing protein [Leuconostoc]RDG19963.1 AzlD domain-containing protein [Leuconostoc pseudomesenteroides]MCT4378267.1 AzlD domain-containing protein [Leuconostoc falkenbergense]MCT4390874.1 AzlD domain-containing protein [Leuconostoc falkenbergense]MCT4411989.1 AzlD domain-containing protein [Leuconostoc falkenbergense]MCX7578471.1 AzlD domain-containing protein [Leuconostoc falkenbergense]